MPGGGCQDSNNLSPLDPSLWYSPLGRRFFLKKSGKAGAATVLAVNGMMFEVMASESTLRWEISAQGGANVDESSSGTNFTEDDVLYRYVRAVTVTYTPPSDLPAKEVEWGTSATSTVKVKVTVFKERKAGSVWVKTADPESVSEHTRTKTATIDPQTGVVTYTQGNTSQDHTENGVKITIKNTESPSVTVEGPPGSDILSDTVDASPSFPTRQVQ